MGLLTGGLILDWNANSFYGEKWPMDKHRIEEIYNLYSKENTLNYNRIGGIGHVWRLEEERAAREIL